MNRLFFDNWDSLIRILVISVAAYLALIIILRISGKRTLSKMNAFDLIVTISLGSTLATVILNKTITLSEGVLAFSLLVFLQYIITFFSVRNKKFRRFVKSEPALICYKGEFIRKNMLSERINEDEVWAILREKGFSALNQVDAVVLETDGSMTVIEKIKDPGADSVKSLFNNLKNFDH